MSGMMTPPAADPMAGAPMAGDDAAGAADADDNVVCTITSDGQGGFMVFAGDEPEGDTEGADMSEDDASAMGPSGDAPMGGGSPAPQGQPADSVGAALKIVMGILQDAESSGPGGSASDQFSAGFNGPTAPTPVGGPPGQKYT
jgi:hypothetical protein